MSPCAPRFPVCPASPWRSVGVGALGAVLLALPQCGTRFESGAQPAADAEPGSPDAEVSSPDGGSPSSDADVAESSVPTDGLLLWLRADRGVVASNGFVSQWVDQSGQHCDATQSVAELRPQLLESGMGAGPAIEFDGVDDYLRMPMGFADFTAGVSLFVVLRQTRIGTCAAFLESSNGSEIDDISFGQYQDRILYEVFQEDTSGDPVIYDQPALLAVVHQPDTRVDLFQNGIAAGQAELTLPAAIGRTDNYLGRSLYTQCGPYLGQIGEVLLYSRALSEAERVAVEAELQTRWACCHP
jgi:hypothetical protein